MKSFPNQALFLPKEPVLGGGIHLLPDAAA
jgi:hypothetical protein